MKNTVNNALLRIGKKSWRFRLAGSQLGITQQNPGGQVNEITVDDRLLPAFISHLRHGLQEIREVQEPRETICHTCGRHFQSTEAFKAHRHDLSTSKPRSA